MSLKALIDFLKELLGHVDGSIKGPLMPYDEIEKELQGGTMPCAFRHHYSCTTMLCINILRVLTKCWKYFLVIHVVPLLLFKRKELRKNPWGVLKRRFVLYVRSLCYLCIGLATIAYSQCWMRPVLGSRDFVQTAATSFGCLHLLFEVESRRKEIFLFVLPRIIFTAWNYLTRRKIITSSVPLSENLLFGLGIGVVLDFIRKEAVEVRSAVKSSLVFILGRT